MVFGRLWNFVKRHRRKLTVFGIATGGAYVLYRYIRYYWADLETKEVAKLMISNNRQQYFQSMLQNSDTTTKALLPNVHDHLDALLDTESLTQQLKQGTTKPSRPPAIAGSSHLPLDSTNDTSALTTESDSHCANQDEILHNQSCNSSDKSVSEDTDEQTRLTGRGVDKVAIWKELKVLAFARALSSLYALSIVSVSVRVQLSLLAGYLFLSATPTELLENLEEVQPSCIKKSHALLSDNVKRRYLSLMDEVVNTTMTQLTTHMTQRCRQLLANVSLKERLTLRRLDSLVHDIRLSFESDLSCLHPLDLPLTTNSATAESEDDLVLAGLIAETKDILQSGEYTGVVRACSDTLFASLLDHFADHFQKEDCRERQTISPVPHTQVYDLSLPLARLIPFINAVPSRVLSVHDEEVVSGNFVAALLNSGVLRSFAYNVYSSFSQIELNTEM